VSSGSWTSRPRARWPGIIEAYREFLPVQPETPVVTLLEGNTPLVASRTIQERLRGRLWFKVEGANPTGSFKDRGMTLAVSRALQERSRGVICASTGNTAASAAAYAARAGLPCMVIVPAEGVASAKLTQALASGATVVAVEGTFDRALELAREAAARLTLTLVNSLNPYRLAGQQTAVWEICEALEHAPDLIALPVGNAGNISAFWQGLAVYAAQGGGPRRTRLLGVQAAGAAPLVEGRVIAQPTTVASAIRVGSPASWRSAIEAAEGSGGAFLAVTDEEIFEAQDLLAREEGLFVEPAAAAAVAGLLRLSGGGGVPSDGTAVAVLTGHGLKDVATVQARLPLPPPVAATIEAVAARIDGSR